MLGMARGLFLIIWKSNERGVQFKPMTQLSRKDLIVLRLGTIKAWALAGLARKRQLSRHINIAIAVD
jgi:hypothetical protein